MLQDGVIFRFQAFLFAMAGEGEAAIQDFVPSRIGDRRRRAIDADEQHHRYGAGRC